MTKVSSFIVAVACLGMMAGCNNMSYKKTKSGLLYKIISTGNAPLVKAGEIAKVHFTQKLNDSLMGSSRDKMPAYIKIDPNMKSAQYDASEIFPLLHKGDSAVIIMMVDSLMAKMPGGLPPYMKRGDKIIFSLKVVDVFNNDSIAKIDSDKEMAIAQARQAKESEEKLAAAKVEVDKYIADKKINAKRIENGTFVEIKSEGTGPVADSGKYITMRYTGRVLKTGKQFETNMEAGKEPLKLTLGQHQVISGWDEGLKGLKKGTKATLYIPGTAAYGPQPGPGGSVYESLVFDVEVVDVADAPAAPTADSTHMHK